MPPRRHVGGPRAWGDSPGAQHTRDQFYPPAGQGFQGKNWPPDGWRASWLAARRGPVWNGCASRGPGVWCDIPVDPRGALISRMGRFLTCPAKRMSSGEYEHRTAHRPVALVHGFQAQNFLRGIWKPDRHGSRGRREWPNHHPGRDRRLACTRLFCVGFGPYGRISSNSPAAIARSNISRSTRTFGSGRLNGTPEALTPFSCTSIRV